RLTQWSKPGLLLIGDAAHVMSPVGGVGINYAVQDAIETANVLSEPLLKSNVTTADLDLVRKHREFATKVIQRFQEVIQKRIVLAGLDDSQTFRPPWFLKLPIIRNMPVRLIAFGVNRSRLKE
ncbi:FAD-dependent monooxygenase, partial [Symmachiella dynata]|uniref:FAD-dependent monooxygenase n=1 Tax=Symmachiella dynata TaxID=2527995 RepID=UPI0030EE36CB